MAPKKSKTSKAEEQAEDAGVELQQAAPKDKSKVPGGKAGGAASGEDLLQVSLLLRHDITILDINKCNAVSGFALAPIAALMVAQQ